MAKAKYITTGVHGFELHDTPFNIFTDLKNLHIQKHSNSFKTEKTSKIKLLCLDNKQNNQIRLNL